MTEIGSPEIYGGKYVEYLRGYFYAPVTGEYRFSGIVDDFLMMKMAKYQNNSNPVNL